MILPALAAVAALVFLAFEASLGPASPFIKMVPVAVLALMVHRSPGGAGKNLAVAGLLVSALADVAIEYRFLLGLVTFLIAHLFYIGAFTRVDSRWRWARLAPVAVWAVLALPALARGAGVLRVPVVLYGLVIFVMIWRAAAAAGPRVRWDAGGLGLMGALLFGISDTLLGYNRFVASFPGSDVAVIGTYWAGQSLIAWSFMRSR